MDDRTATFVNELGLAFEQEGLPRIAGRMMGFLLANEGAYSLDEMAEVLDISKTSASTNARMLDQLGILTRRPDRGDRRDYYELAENYWEHMFTTAKRRMRRMHDVLAAAEGSLPTSMTAGRRRIRRARRLYGFMLEEFDEKIGRWRRQLDEMEREEPLGGGRADEGRGGGS